MLKKTRTSDISFTSIRLPAERNYKDDSGQFLHSSVFLLALISFFVFASVTGGIPLLLAEEAPLEVVPSRVIQAKGAGESGWVVLWNEARELARNGKFPEAANKYQLLLEQKSNLEPAQWECVQVLLSLERFSDAVSILEVLLESNPAKLDYLEALGGIMMKQGHLSRAAELYRHAYDISPVSTPLLAKLCQILLQLGNDRETLPYLEELYNRQPTDEALQQDIARLYYRVGEFEKARGLLAAVAKGDDADLEMVTMAARVHEKLGLQNLAVDYWKKVVVRQPENREGHDRLLAYYELEGRDPEALRYLLALLEQQPEKPGLLKRVGQIYVGMTKFAEALPYFERYIALRPDDKEVLRMVIDIYSALGERQQSLTALDRYFTLEPQPDIDNLLQAAKLYEAGERFEDAAVLYEKILKTTPNDTAILARLAWTLLAAGKEEAASSMWQQLARRNNLLEVLEELHKLEPYDQRLIERLAFMYADLGFLHKARIMFEKLESAWGTKAETLKAQARLYEILNWPEHALVAYENLLKYFPEQKDVILPMIRLSGKLGLGEGIWRYWERFSQDIQREPREDERTVLAEALRGAHAYVDARKIYRLLLEDENAVQETKLKAFLGTAETYWEDGLYYEAEQALREALSGKETDFKVFRRLFEFSLEKGRYEEAAVWLRGLRDYGGASRNGFAGVSATTNRYEISLLRARLLMAEGQHRAALKTVRRLVGELESLEEISQAEPTFKFLRREAEVSLCRFSFIAGKVDEAEQQGLLLSEKYPDDLEIPVLLSRIYISLDAPEKARKEVENSFEFAAKDFGLILQLVELFQEYGAIAEMTEAVKNAAHRNPDSIRAQFMLSDVLVLQEDYQGATKIIQKLVEKYPHRFEPRMKLVNLLLKSGRTNEAFDLCEVLLVEEQRPDLLLIKGRILWGQKKWDEAIAVYKSFLKPAVEELFVANCNALGVKSPPPEKRSLWEMIKSGKTDEKVFLDGVMQPVFTVNRGQENQVYTFAASPLFSLYCWQEHFNLELKGRKAVVRREYFAAVKYFEELVEKFPEDASLQFDLAGIYSRLGYLGKEAALYDRIAEGSGALPGLSEAIQRNNLKLKPRSSLLYGYRKEEGREGYKSLRSEWFGADFWLSPKSHQEVDISLKRINYQATDISRKLESSRAELSYAASLTDRVGILLGGGFEAFDDGHPDAALFSCALKAAVGNRVNSSVTFSRDLVHDTTASLSRQIIAHSLDAGAVIDLFPGLSAGGQYSLIDYSDNNMTNGYDLWAAYRIVSDPVTLEFKYTYDFKESNEGSIPGVPLDDGFALDDHPYWAPQNYWQNRFNVFFKHPLSDEPYDRGVPSYYSAEYSVAYDSRGYAIQNWTGRLFLELSSDVTLEASGEVTTSQEYRDKKFFLSFSYRW